MGLSGIWIYSLISLPIQTSNWLINAAYGIVSVPARAMNPESHSEARPEARPEVIRFQPEVSIFVTIIVSIYVSIFDSTFVSIFVSTFVSIIVSNVEVAAEDIFPFFFLTIFRSIFLNHTIAREFFSYLFRLITYSTFRSAQKNTGPGRKLPVFLLS